MRHRLWGLLGLLGLALALTFPKSTLYVEGNGKRHLLKVEVADTPERWAAHYGDQWPRLCAAKRRWDPAGILAPGFIQFA